VTSLEVISHLNNLPEKEKEDRLFQILQDWINYLDSKGITAIRTYFSGLNRYLRYHRIKLTKEDIKEELTFPRKIEEERYALTLEDIHKIFKVAKYKMQGIYLAMLTSGMRPSEAVSLRKKHFKFLPENSKYMITIPAKATKLKRERTVFTSREVTPYISKAIKGRSDNDLIWSKNEIAKNAVSNAGGVFSNYCEKVGLDERFETTGSHKVNLYCFRAYFFTKAARLHGEEYAHKLIGHTGYLPQYDRKSLEEKLEMYEELEPELFVFDMTKKDEKIKQLTQANTEIDKLRKDLDKVKRWAQPETQERLFLAGMVGKQIEFHLGQGAQKNKVKSISGFQEYLKMINPYISNKTRKNTKNFI